MRHAWMFVIMMLCAALLFVSCEQPAKNNYKDQQTERQEPQSIEKAPVAADKEVFYDLTFNYEPSSLVLSDLGTNEELKSITLDKNSFAGRIEKLDQGFAVEILSADEPVRIHKSGGIEAIGYPSSINKVTYRIYSRDLELEREVDLTGILPQELLDVNSLKAISHDGSKMLWCNALNAYVYDTKSGKLDQVLDESNSTLILDSAVFTNNNDQIVFFGSQVGDDEDKFSYGLIDLGSKQVTVHKEQQYQGSQIVVSDRYAGITDRINPENNKSSGKVLLLDLQTRKSIPIQVDGTESAMARVAADGRYLVAVKQLDDGSYRTRQYELKTGKIMKEETFQPEKLPSKPIRILPSQNSSIFYIQVFAGEGNYSYHTFVSEE